MALSIQPDPSDPLTCPECGYNLAGLPSRTTVIRCPECGARSGMARRVVAADGGFENRIRLAYLPWAIYVPAAFVVVVVCREVIGARQAVAPLLILLAIAAALATPLTLLMLARRSGPLDRRFWDDWSDKVIEIGFVDAVLLVLALVVSDAV